MVWVLNQPLYMPSFFQKHTDLLSTCSTAFPTPQCPMSPTSAILHWQLEPLNAVGSISLGLAADPGEAAAPMLHPPTNPAATVVPTATVVPPWSSPIPLATPTPTEAPPWLRLIKKGCQSGPRHSTQYQHCSS